MIVVGDKEIEVIKRGYSQAVQVAKLSRWISKYVAPVVSNAASDIDSDNTMAAGLAILVEVLGSVEPETLVSLGQIVTGEDEEFVKEHFDMDWLIEGAMILLQQKTFARLLEPFFGKSE